MQLNIFINASQILGCNWVTGRILWALDNAVHEPFFLNFFIYLFYLLYKGQVKSYALAAIGRWYFLLM